MTTYRISIDRSLCCGYSTCTEVAPDLFELDGEGLAVARAAATSNAAALDAVDGCPMAAIRAAAEEAA